MVNSNKSCYLGPSYMKRNPMNEFLSRTFIHRDTIRSKILNEYINLDDKFYLPLCDFLSMLDEVNPNFTPKIYYEQSMNYPELYKEHLDLMNNV